ncbi:hypothetical protein K440DRAFT_642243 [Wilcoxina mikolae CBS 423.85]|nr:hypothetical protein K440DRAFT_642243 [Wilcoxina mikolae CBS 423.85]
MPTPTSNLPNHNKTQWGNVPLLTHLNYDLWVETMILILEAMGAYNIVTGEEPKPQDQPLQDYFNKLRDFHHQLAGSIEAISDDELRTHIYTTMSEQYTITVKILQHQTPIPTVDEVMDTLKEDEGTTAITKEIRDATIGMALYTQRGSYRGRGRDRGRGRSHGNW